MAKLIETPYGRKTPELLCKAMDVHVMLPGLIDDLKAALELINNMMPGVRHVALQDYRSLNDTPLALRAAIEKLEEKQ